MKNFAIINKSVCFLLATIFCVISYAQPGKETSKLFVTKFSCAGIDSLSLIILSDADSVCAQLQCNGNFSGHYPDKVKLTQEQFNHFNSFKKQLKKLKEGGGCTTVYVYKLIEQKNMIERGDGNCQWFGIEKLLKILFPAQLN